jgi:adenine-specific DNA glycosylase
MLKQLLDQFRHASRPLCAADLRAALALDPGVIEGMIQTLVARGRLVEVVDPATCHTCPVKGGCVIMDLAHPRRYTLPRPAASSPS